jgi:hypothetical protein
LFTGGRTGHDEKSLIVLLLSIFRWALRPSATRGALVPFYFPGVTLPFKIKNKKFLLVIYDTSSIREPPKTEGKKFF